MKISLDCPFKISFAGFFVFATVTSLRLYIVANLFVWPHCKIVFGTQSNVWHSWHRHVQRDIKGTVSRYFDPLFHDCNHSGPLLMVQKLSSIVDTKESNSALSLTPQSQTPRGQWHCGVKHAVNNVAKKILQFKEKLSRHLLLH